LSSDAISDRPKFPSSKYSRAVEDKKKVVGKSAHIRTFRGRAWPDRLKPHMAVAPINIVSVKEAIAANTIRDTREGIT